MKTTPNRATVLLGEFQIAIMILVCVPRHCSQVVARIGMNSAELGQIGVTGLRGHYGFTTNEEGKNKRVFFVGNGGMSFGGGGCIPC